MHQVSRASDSITVSWPRPDRTDGNILDYQLRYYDQVGAEGGPGGAVGGSRGPTVARELGAPEGCLRALQPGSEQCGVGQGGSGPHSRQGVSGCHPPPQAEDESHSFTLTSATNTATVTKLSPGHTYGFQVRARTAAGHGPYGGKVYFQTLPQGEGRPGWGAGGPKGW